IPPGSTSIPPSEAIAIYSSFSATIRPMRAPSCKRDASLELGEKTERRKRRTKSGPTTRCRWLCETECSPCHKRENPWSIFFMFSFHYSLKNHFSQSKIGQYLCPTSLFLLSSLHAHPRHRSGTRHDRPRPH